MKRPLLLDLFCGAGGAGMGYHRAGFHVVGVDIKPQPNYPFAFFQYDALEFLAVRWPEFAAIHASPPCQRFSIATFCRESRDNHVDLLTPTLKMLEQIKRPWIVENVPGAPMGENVVTLCGLMFDLKVFRHRQFKSNSALTALPHPSHRGIRLGENGMVCVAGHGGQSSGFGNYKRRIPADHRTKRAWETAMGIDWMSRDELAQAIPPAYTEHLGRQLLQPD